MRKFSGASTNSIIIGSAGGAAPAYILPRRKRRASVSKYMPHIGFKQLSGMRTPEAIARREAEDRAWLEAEAVENAAMLQSQE